jgi:hypothetical protein
MKAKTSYQIMVSILGNYNPTKEEKLIINSFFMCRYLSGNPKAIFVGNFINRYYNEIPQDIQYDLSKQLLRGKIKFIQPPRKDKNDDKILENITRYYKISMSDAIQYFELMDKQERIHFEELYDGQ